MKKIDHNINKILAIFAKKNSVLTIAMKFHLKNTIKADITVITLEKIEALLIMFVI